MPRSHRLRASDAFLPHLKILAPTVYSIVKHGLGLTGYSERGSTAMPSPYSNLLDEIEILGHTLENSLGPCTGDDAAPVDDQAGVSDRENSDD